MTKNTLYRQCGLRRYLDNDASLNLVTFIPAKYAKLQRIVRLKDDHGDWEDGWEVVSVGVGVDQDQLPNFHSDIKGHRKMTGDSLRR